MPLRPAIRGLLVRSCLFPAGCSLLRPPARSEPTAEVQDEDSKTWNELERDMSLDSD